MEKFAQNLSQQEEEVLALSSIYGDLFTKEQDSESSYLCRVPLQTEEDWYREVKVRIHFPPTYPSDEPPLLELVRGNPRFMDHLTSKEFYVDDDTLKELLEGLSQLWENCEVVFTWIEWIKEFLEERLREKVELWKQELQELPEEKEQAVVDYDQIDEDEEVADGKPSTGADKPVNCPEIFSGEPLVDRKSVFVAHVATVRSVEEVKAVMQTLLQDKKVARATHNMSAYRIVQEGDIMLQDNDDDGETAAGRRLLHLMQILDVKNVFVVVSRWYGGIPLHADRFKDINNCARDLLEQCGYIEEESSDKKASKSKKKGKK
ncbi:UPF0029-domain-containing protein [Basidiobolus meristosporus CBS 931.73]|uniref:UPF0029-domain-containing protein n=1 Tax=Basidiobolus meristosporus CBS 931.73 TaxID=1314790 RepID=A0A1Y1ZBC5_9FUNG|nr:UPF0029-domain-containing protein [Basidiobolus meristosporus CBS 931.73]|eukprot:ORY07581.1 UPF0029-domain-containing protein [Basidiobolus meristosporus CBS 931.73]